MSTWGLHVSAERERGGTDSVGVPGWAVGRLLAWTKRLPSGLFCFFILLFLFYVFQKQILQNKTNLIQIKTKIYKNFPLSTYILGSGLIQTNSKTTLKGFYAMLMMI
jgi:hypothetical protein